MKDERWVNRFSYVWNDSLFYQPVDVHYNPSTRSFADVLDGQVEGRFAREGIWWMVNFFDNERRPLDQGWKIHVSAHPGNAERILRAVSAYCSEKRVSFKFALDFNVLEFLNSKAMSRGGSGKFITIYPSSTAQFREIIGDLATLLSGEQGPYILSDMRYKDSKVLYFRYGAFQKKHTVDIMGRKVPVISAPSGELVPDKREPYFSLPEWLEWPFQDWQTPQDGDDSQLTLSNRYEILEALSFSNSGGVYLARDLRTGRKVVVKEARSFTNFNAAGSYDAVALLRKEWKILQLLRDTRIAPRPLDLFQEWEHLYLVEEFVDGTDIREALFRKSHPLLKVYPTRRDSARYLKSFFRLFRNLALAIQKAHEKGVLLGDLSARNFLIKRNSHRVVLIDFEASIRFSAESAAKDKLDKPVLLYTLGFRQVDRASRSVYDEYDDLFSLASIMCYYIYPVSAYSVLRNDVFHTVYKQLILDMGWPEELHAFIVSIFEGEQSLGQIIDFLLQQEGRMLQRVRTPLREDSGRRRPSKSRSLRVRVSERVRVTAIFDSETPAAIQNWTAEITRFLEHAANPSGEMLFPSDPFASLTNPLSLGFGAGGVLYVLQRVGYRIPDSWKRWFLDHAKRIDPLEFAPGLLTGLAGIAWTLLELGEVETARKVLCHANRHPRLDEDYTFYYGISGVGMTNLKFYLSTGDANYLNSAVMLYRRLMETAYCGEEKTYWSNNFSGDTPFIGLGFGQSGVALFLLRLHQLLGDKKPLQHGESALLFDLDQGEYVERGVMSFRYNGTLDPYVEVGSAGIAKVLLRYGWIDQARPLLNDLYHKYSVLSGYLFGISGIIDTFVDAYLFTKEADYLSRLRRPLEGLRVLHLFEPKSSTNFIPPDKIPEGMAVPGEGLLRVSCDFGTGCAGTLRVLHRLTSLDHADFMLDEVISQ